MACIFGHKWDGCKCTRCGKIRDEQHDFDLCKGKCRRCGKNTYAEHDWIGCKCSRCGQISHANHKWNGCKCEYCGLVKHNWSNCVCKTCGEKRDEHDWGDYKSGYVCRCKICGEIREKVSIPPVRGRVGQEDFRELRIAEHTGPWSPVSSCINKCCECGVLAYDHDYQETSSKHHDLSDSTSHVYICTKCGHSYTHLSSWSIRRCDIHGNYGGEGSQRGHVKE